MNVMSKIMSLLIVLGVAVTAYYGIGWRHNLAVRQTLEAHVTRLQSAIQTKSTSAAASNTVTTSIQPKPAHTLTAPHLVLTINYNNFGFMPSIATVPVGTKVTIENTTTEGGMDFKQLPTQAVQNSNLNLGIIEMGQSKSFILNQKGKWIYENSWETTDLGQITVV